MLQTANMEVLVSASGTALAGKPYPVQQDNPDIGGGDPETEALAYVANSTETYDEQAYIDPTLQRDIDSIKDYTRRSAATVIAVATGNWTTATTWWNITTGTQAVPGAGAHVLIPKGIDVTYNQVSTTEYGTIRVDGGFIWDATQNTELHCDTIYVDHTGTYQLATSGSPASSSFTQKLLFTNNGALDVTNDAVKMQRGLVCFGQASIYAAPVIGITRATGGLSATDNQVTLDRQVQGVAGFRDWKVNDELIIAGTQLRGHVMAGNWQTPTTEVVTITAIDNTTPTAPVITFTPALSHGHPVCWKRSGWTAHVVNRTRNFQTYTKGEPTDAQRRAHQLFKNKDQNTVEYVEAWAMGRTDMDVLTLGSPPVKLSDMPTITSTTNTTGRYIWHFHRNGADDPAANPSVFRGCVGYDSPGWVFVHHDSHGNMIDCIAYDFQAVGFTGEGGGTWGEIDGCIAIANRETAERATVATIKDGGNDIGDIGHGFWTSSRPLNFKNCVAVDCTVGMGWTSRVSFNTSPYPGITEEIRAFYGLASDPTTTVPKTFAVIEGFENNEIYACNWGMSIAKLMPTQHHDLISFFNGCKIWEVQEGFHAQYTGLYSMKDFEVIGLNPAYRPITGYEALRGFRPYRQALGMNFINPIIEEFRQGIDFTTTGGQGMNENMDHKVVNPTFVNCDDNYTADNSAITLPWSASANGFTDAAEIASGAVGDSTAGAITAAYVEDSCTWAGGSNKVVIAWDFQITDSLGTHRRQRGVPKTNTGFGLEVTGQSEANTFAEQSKNAGMITLINSTKMQLMMQQEGVYTSAAGDKILLIPDIAQDRFSGLSTYFYTPVALRMSQNEFDAILPNYGSGTGDNGALGTHGGQNFTSFNPAGTPGLT